MKIRTKALGNNFGLKATTDEVNVTTKPSFGENEGG